MPRVDEDKIIKMHSGCTANHALEVAKLNPEMTVEVEYVVAGSLTKLHINVVED